MAERDARRKPGSPNDPDTPASSEYAGSELERLKQENERLRKQLAEQAKRIADLERQLALRQQNSTTTSKPPSSDGLAGRPRERGRRLGVAADREGNWVIRATIVCQSPRPRRRDRRPRAGRVSPVCTPVARA